MNVKLRKTAVLAASFALALSMSVPSFAASGTAADPVQDKSSDTATIYVGKDLAVSQAGKFPSVTDFNFELEAVRAWDNANTDAKKSGEVIPVSEMPMPAVSSEDHRKVALTDEGKAEIQAGSFAGDANTSKADTDTEKYRSTPVNIRFTKAGYYMYRIRETSSTPDKIPGMAYDPDSYYVVVYVCNKTDENGNTVSGVYVHDITSYRNSIDTDHKPDLSDIQNITDNGGTPAAENNYDNLAKVGKSDPEPGTDPETGHPKGPDKLEAFRFFNDQTTHDVVITNNVTGNLGDITKEFEYTVTITGLEKNKEYTTGTDAEGKTDKKSTSASAEIQDVTGGKGAVDPSAKTFTSDAEGNATFMMKLADDEVMVFNALPATAQYSVEEHASDHIASYTSESTEPDTWIMAAPEKANAHSDTALSTGKETVDAVSNVPGRSQLASEDNDGTVTINFRNHRDLLTPTGVPYFGDFAYMLAVLMTILTALFVIRVKRSRAE